MMAKKNAAEKGIELIQNGMTVGLGSGSTAEYAIEKIGENIRGGLTIKAVASSLKSEKLARRLSIPIVDPSEVGSIDIAIDGADEVDKKGNLIKGGGGSLLREKILAFAGKRFYVMVDASKLVDQLGKETALPVEITPFAANITLKQIETLGCKPAWRKHNGERFISDNGNFIADCTFDGISDPAWLDVRLKMIPGVVETGLFLNQVVTAVIVGYESGETKVIEVNA